jgi:hypothetical protein
MGVFDHDAVDDVGEAPFEAAEGFTAGLAGSPLPGLSHPRWKWLGVKG